MKEFIHTFHTYINEIKKSFDTYIHKDNKAIKLWIPSLSVISLIGVTRSFEASLGMGIFILLILIFTTLLFKGLQPYLSNAYSFPLFVLLLITTMTIYRLLFNAFAYALTNEISIFIAVSAFNIYLFLTLFYKMKEMPLKQSLNTVLITCRDMILLLTIIGFLRELLATGTIHIGTLLPLSFHLDLLSFASLNTYALPLFNQVPGAFIISSIVISGYQAYQSRKDVM